MQHFFVSLGFILGCLSDTAAQKKQVDVGLIKSTVEDWSAAHNTKDKKVFEALYAPTLLFYTKEISGEEAVKQKLVELNSYQSYEHKLASSLGNIFFQSGIIKCEFTLIVKRDGMENEYAAYLLLERSDNFYRIVGESDVATDKKLGYQLVLGETYKVNQLEKVTFTEETPVGFSKFFPLFQLILTLVIGIGGLILVYRSLSRRKKQATTMPGITERVGNEKTIIRKESKLNPQGYQEKRRGVREAFSRPKGEKVSDLSFEIKKRKGDEFEAFILERFPTKYFRIRYWNSDLSHKGVFPESNTYPDLEIVYDYGQLVRVFAVECKFRSTLVGDVFELESRQLDNYRKYSREKSIPVYIALGLFGLPTNPRKLFLIPLEMFYMKTSLTEKELTKFERDKNSFLYDRKYDLLR